MDNGFKWYETERVFLVLSGLSAFSVITWLTHVIVCLNDGDWGFLIAGAIFVPVAIIHGFGVWFGIWAGLWY